MAYLLLIAIILTVALATHMSAGGWRCDREAHINNNDPVDANNSCIMMHVLA